MSKGWWSFGPRGSRADARLAKSRAKPALRPSFEVTLRPGEADAWTAVELCLHLWGERLMHVRGPPALLALQ